MPQPNSPAVSDTRASRERMEKLAWLLDGAIPVPGTRFRFGLDSIIGLIPGVGDLVGLLLGAAILYEGARIGAPRPLMFRMLGNSVADALMGVVPVLGDVLDFAFRSNRRNAKLLMDHLDRIDEIPGPVHRGSQWLALFLAAGFVAASVALVWWVWTGLLS
ncbi:MAG: DUF4112 domain-containing protein [Panacagrimonas sp.]